MDRQAAFGLNDATVALWNSTDGAGFLRAQLSASWDNAHTAHTGNRLTDVLGPGHVVMTWTPGPQLANLSGFVHGGYTALVCDEAGGLATASTGERFVPSLTLDLDVTYLRPGQLGKPHRVEGTVLHRGRQRIVAEVHVYTPDEKLMASARGSFLPNAAFLERARASLSS